MKRVIIESPYAGKKLDLPWFLKWLSWIVYKITTYQNVLYARKCLYDSLQRGEAAFASHLLYTQVLDDKKIEDREKGISAGFLIGKDFDLTAVYVDKGISYGMIAGCSRAHMENRKIEERSIRNKK